MRFLILFLLLKTCIASDMKCPTCFGNDQDCKFVEEISCSEHTVKPISGFCAGFDDRAMWGLPYVCLNVYDYSYYRRYQGCFHRFSDQLDMCSILKKVCPHDFDCTNSTNEQAYDQFNGNILGADLTRT